MKVQELLVLKDKVDFFLDIDQKLYTFVKWGQTVTHIIYDKDCSCNILIMSLTSFWLVSSDDWYMGYFVLKVMNLIYTCNIWYL